jgi:hypothetical protein
MGLRQILPVQIKMMRATIVLSGQPGRERKKSAAAVQSGKNPGLCDKIYFQIQYSERQALPSIKKE